MQKISSTTLLRLVSGGAPEKEPPPPPPKPSVAIVGGGNEDFAYGKVIATIPITPQVNVQPYVVVNTNTGLNEVGAGVVVKF